MPIYEALTHNYRVVHTQELFRPMSEETARELVRRKTWKRIAKTSPRLIQFFRHDGFFVALRPGGTWGRSNLHG